MTKIGIYSFETQTNITQHPEEFRPIGLCRDRWELTGDFDEADWVYFYLDYLKCNEQGRQLVGDPVWNEYAEKGIFYAMHDTPQFAYVIPEGIKFIAQPLLSRAENLEHNVVSVPLQMRKFELEVIKDREFIEEIRCIPKQYDFCFIGQTGYFDRKRFRPENLKLPAGSRYLFEETQPIWGVQDLQERVKLTKDFCRKVASSKFCFAPRGVGSSSFRLYQSLISGTIPIIYGMKERPFQEVLDWGEFSINGDWGLDTEDYMNILSHDLDSMKQAAIDAWDNYFHMEKTDEYLFNKYLEKDNEISLNSRWYIQ